jgi:hypothetical protein
MANSIWRVGAPTLSRQRAGERAERPLQPHGQVGEVEELLARGAHQPRGGARTPPPGVGRELAGRRAFGESRARIAAIEECWRGELGDRRYATLVKALRDVTARDAPGP